MKWDPLRGWSISFHRQLHPPISLLGRQIMKLWWNVLGKQDNYIEHNYIDEMKKYIDEIVPGMKLREAWNSPFHWKPLGKQWNGQHSISLKSISKTMKWTTRRLPQFHSWDNYIDGISSMKWVIQRGDEISSKTVSKTMKWAMLNFIENH